MSDYATPLPLELISEQFRHLPGVGKKTAMKYAMRFLEMSDEEAVRFAEGILEAKRQIRRCRRCFHFTTEELCSICADPERDESILCIVEDSRAVMAMERVQEYKGRYHVLEGLLSPMDGKGPDQLRIKELMARVDEGVVKEAIIATNPTPEGEATAMYLCGLLRPKGIRLTRLAYGIPVGADLEYADEVTLAARLAGRQTF